MSDKPLDPALTEFTTSIDEISVSALFVELAEKVRPRFRRFIAWEGVQSEERTLLRDFMRSECNTRPIYEGLIVRLVASFEWFLRRSVRDLIRSVNARGMPFDRLPGGLLDRNRQCVGRALSTVFHPSDYLEINFDGLCKELGTCIPGTKPVTLSADAFAAAIFGVSVDRIGRAFEALGVRLDWDRVGKHTDIRKAVSETGVRKAAKAAQEMVRETQKRRNLYAHAGSGSTEVSAEDVRRRGVFFQALATALKEQLEERETKAK